MIEIGAANPFNEPEKADTRLDRAFGESTVTVIMEKLAPISVRTV